MNVAARMGTWSAGHRKTAIIGWLIFVLAALVIGSSGTKQITNAEGSNGQTAKAERVLTSSGFPNAASENVLVQTKNGQPDDAALRSAVTQVVAAVSSTKLIEQPALTAGRRRAVLRVTRRALDARDVRPDRGRQHRGVASATGA